MSVLQDGYDAFQDGNYEQAMLHYLQASEMGLELGQSNAAWLLTHVRPSKPYSLPRILPSCGSTALEH